MWLLFTILFLLCYVLLTFVRINKRPKNYPTVPHVSIPLVGHLPYFRNVGHSGLHKRFIEYGNKYGKVIGIDIGTYRFVVINDYKLIKEAWNNLLLCGRSKMPAVAERTNGVVRGLMFQDGEEWSEQRRFALRQLRDFGFGKKSMESLVVDEAMELIEGFNRDAGLPVSTQNRFNVAVLNALWCITAGQRFHHDDPQLKEIVAAITRSVSAASPAKNIMYMFMPWLIRLVPGLCGWNDFKKELSYTYNFLADFARNVLDTYEGNAPQHFAHVYIDEVRATQNVKSSFYGKRGEETMIATLQDLFVAGAETTSTTLTWAFLYLSIFPEKQDKLHQEIDNVLGHKFPTLEDRNLMPYTEAVILETLRFSAMVPLGLFHRATATVRLDKYIIPKDTIIIPNLYASLHDPVYWGDPGNFRPERFLSPEPTQVIKHDAFIPFSYGKRICIGESLAKDELFLFLTSIFQRFNVRPDPNAPTPTTQQVCSVISMPKPHKLVFLSRKP